MIRDFQYSPSAAQIKEVLKEFKLDFAAEKSQLDLLKFEVVSPDSFIWKLLLGNSIYYLYAEDYIAELGDLKNSICYHLNHDKWDFVMPREISATMDQPESFTQYAVKSGYDYVFLVKTLENPDDAHFPGVKK